MNQSQCYQSEIMTMYRNKHSMYLKTMQLEPFRKKIVKNLNDL